MVVDPSGVESYRWYVLKSFGMGWPFGFCTDGTMPAALTERNNSKKSALLCSIPTVLHHTVFCLCSRV